MPMDLPLLKLEKSGLNERRHEIRDETMAVRPALEGQSVAATQIRAVGLIQEFHDGLLPFKAVSRCHVAPWASPGARSVPMQLLAERHDQPLRRRRSGESTLDIP